MEEMQKVVQLVYDFGPATEFEESALCELIGGEMIYKAIKVFKDKKRPAEEATKFLIRLNDICSIQELM